MKNVCKGIIDGGILVKDENGQTATIMNNGQLSNNLYGLDFNSICALEMIKINRLKK
jgi:hypothetical protein